MSKRASHARKRPPLATLVDRAVALGAGPCTLCDECAFWEGCRHPDAARPAVDARAIDVSRAARANGPPSPRVRTACVASAKEYGFEIDVARGSDETQHCFGVVLVE